MIENVQVDGAPSRKSVEICGIGMAAEFGVERCKEIVWAPCFRCRGCSPQKGGSVTGGSHCVTRSSR